MVIQSMRESDADVMAFSRGAGPVVALCALHRSAVPTNEGANFGGGDLHPACAHYHATRGLATSDGSLLHLPNLRRAPEQHVDLR